MKHIRIFSALCISAVFASCNQGGTDPQVNDGGIWTIPSVGSRYIYVDSVIGNTILHPVSDSLIVIKTGQQIGTKTNAILLLDQMFDDTEIYCFEPNGDFSFGGFRSRDSDGIISDTLIWNTFPTGSRKTIPIEKAVDSFDTFGDHIISSDQIEFVGTEYIDVPAGFFLTLHLRQTSNFDNISSVDPANTLTDSNVYDIWFAPSIRYYVKSMTLEMMNGNVNNNYLEELKKYLPR
jgi:hypothetical protein